LAKSRACSVTAISRGRPFPVTTPTSQPTARGPQIPIVPARHRRPNAGSRFPQEIGSQFATRIEGTCVKHRFGKSSIKIYDKFALVLRIETTTNVALGLLAAQALPLISVEGLAYLAEHLTAAIAMAARDGVRRRRARAVTII
jgi:hypothetical protein